MVYMIFNNTIFFLTYFSRKPSKYSITMYTVPNIITVIITGNGHIASVLFKFFHNNSGAVQIL